MARASHHLYLISLVGGSTLLGQPELHCCQLEIIKACAPHIISAIASPVKLELSFRFQE